MSDVGRDGLTGVLSYAHETRDRAREALRETDQHGDIQYLDALITVIDYHRDNTFDTDRF
jgi:hypothetical protein